MSNSIRFSVGGFDQIHPTLATESSKTQPDLIYMKQSLAHVAIVVRDYDEAIEFYTKKLNFRLVLVAPPGTSGCSLLLAQASNEEQQSAIGKQSGGRVFLFLFTDDFDRDYHAMLKNGITFTRTPAVETYGKVAVFEDLYGNLWDLIQPTGIDWS
jgi:catechol 2,3-dioxygenase-like lactoylglutathione lyase family enzyme